MGQIDYLHVVDLLTAVFKQMHLGLPCFTLESRQRTWRHAGRSVILDLTDDKPLALLRFEFLFKQIVDLRRVGLALARLHHLADKEGE